MGLIGDIGGAITAPLTAGVNALSTHFTNKSNRKYNTWMFRQQEESNLRNWNMQNDYNSPSAQMARLKAAGLNPNMVYGNGGAVTTAQPIQKASPGNYQGEAPQINPNAITAFFDIMRTVQQTDNLKAQKDLLEKQADMLETNRLSKILGMQKIQWDMSRGDKLLPLQMQSYQANIGKTQADTDFTMQQKGIARELANNTLAEGAQRIAESIARTNNYPITAREIEARIKKLGKETDILGETLKLNQKGFSWSDPYYIRAGIKLAQTILNELGVTPTIKGFYEDITRPLTAKPGGWRKP